MGFHDDAGDTATPRQPARVRFGALGEAWGLFKAEWATWLVIGLAVVAGNWAVYGTLYSVFRLKAPVGLGGFRVGVPPARDLVPAAVVAAVNGLFLGGMFRTACLQVRGRRVTPGDALGVTDVLPELALGSVLVGVALSVAASFCFLPALVLAGTWMFTVPLIVDGRLRAVDAIGRSWGALRGHWLKATAFHAVAGLIAGLGGCLFCVGIFLTMPLYCLSIAALYRDFFLAKADPGPWKPNDPDPDF